ncbi:DUF421 domain-containing protein [Bacillus sp. V3B]|uniref:DUF421 domain-containing protein n=1 Tax=Bacillus sp. V3B TaxID=2804915 RepID=UPI00210CF1E1|nr:DUF421 domain-containing protein [Bacillus sp. V3B]MCQ6276490.1 DUF421 domain-containing protein [Bacillus sp. V3B]
MSDWTDTFIRSIVFIIVLIIMTKLLGKKQLSEISFFEYVSGITIGSIAGEAIMGLDNKIGHGVLAILVFSLITLFVDILSLKSKKFRDTIEGTGTIFIKDGKIMEDNLKKEKYSTTELESLLRQKDVFNMADVEFAILEPKGDLSVLLKKENRPLTAKDLNLKVANDKVPQTVIMDGSIINDAMSAAGKDRNWLHAELDKLGVTVENVFMAQVDSYGDLTIDVYDDQMNIPSPEVRPLLMAMIKKCQADLELFSLETESDKAQAMYNKNAKKLTEVIDILKPYLKG